MGIRNLLMLEVRKSSYQSAIKESSPKMACTIKLFNKIPNEYTNINKINYKKKLKECIKTIVITTTWSVKNKLKYRILQ